MPHHTHETRRANNVKWQHFNAPPSSLAHEKHPRGHQRARTKRAVSEASALDISGSTDDLRDQLRGLHADELASLSQNWRSRPTAVQRTYTYFFCRTTRKYITFLWGTWTRAIWSTMFLPTTILDKISIFIFGMFSSVFIFVVLLGCLAARLPLLSRMMSSWSEKNADGLTMINAGYPSMMHEMSNEQVEAAKVALSKPPEDSPNTSTKRVFNLDIGKLFFQLSALMYERTSAPLHDALEASLSKSRQRHARKHDSEREAEPGAYLSEVLGPDVARRVSTQLHVNTMEDGLSEFAESLGLRYNTISELNSQGSAFCGIFWDPMSTWMVLAFKGTSPAEFVEWTTDFTFHPRDAGHWIRGWGKVHGGFLDKIFPRRIKPGSRLPYDTIREAVKVVSKHLLVDKPQGTQINVYVTGHSLGCAIASLVYARLINEPRSLGDIAVRDAYLFGAPILCDRDSVNAFNNRMNRNPDRPRTMWRVTNGLDAVARSLPNWGDYGEWHLSPYNLFSFAHIGTEICLRPSTQKCSVAGETHIIPGSQVRIESALMTNVSLLEDTPESIKTQKWTEKLQEWPLVGRFVSHGVPAYWIALNKLSTGACIWEEGSC